MNTTVHTIPVPVGWSVEMAWEAISRGDPLPPGEPAGWKSIVVHDGVLAEVVDG